MENTHPPTQSQLPLRAMVEILPSGELKIFPICSTDAEADKIMDALRFVREDFSDR